MWERVKRNFRRQESGKSEAEYRQELFAQIRASHAEWLRAHRLFHEATGKDEIDYAIFVLEAAERKYQIHLKIAKQQGLHRFHLPADEPGYATDTDRVHKRRAE
ncbi:DUF2508 family protein [Paenibacillus sp. CMAA1739]|uniref:DUF2508 family protein n=1 Tax=Paenibacillus ottowii TaxID=2315729 RepID=UPI002731B2F6|nr:MULTISPECIES: DUF2508 family protein [Paenibacillus]MDP1513322.1 DUF2508 family protein [Paenibacillus ottowii]MEC4569278.1 DUF2508 family protein [Paenibacillus sp. CMAA1739]